MFKRRELRKASPGDFVAIQTNIVEKIVNGKEYKSSSFNNYQGRKHSSYISSGAFAKSHAPHNQISPVDAAIMLYKGPSMYSNDLIEVVPILFHGENYDNAGIRKGVSQGPFYVNKNDVDILGSGSIKASIKSVGYRRAQSSLECINDWDSLGIHKHEANRKITSLIQEVRDES